MSLRLTSDGRLFAIAATTLALTVFAGCGPKPEPMGMLTGTVKSGDKLIGNCKVAIYKSASMDSIAAKVGESATFKIEEIPYGDYEVVVFPMPTDTIDAIPDPRIPKKFRKRQTSGFTVSINKEEETVIDLDLQ